MSLSFYTPPPWPANEEARQQAAAKAITRSASVLPALQRIVEDAAAFFGTPIAAISIVDNERQWMPAAIGIGTGESPRATSFCAHTILDPEKLMIVPDATGDVRFSGNPVVLFDPHVRFYAGVPLVDDAGNAIGALCVVDRTARSGKEDYAPLRDFANRIAQLLFR